MQVSYRVNILAYLYMYVVIDWRILTDYAGPSSQVDRYLSQAWGLSAWAVLLSLDSAGRIRGFAENCLAAASPAQYKGLNQ